jgi:hypothetical protein
VFLFEVFEVLVQNHVLFQQFLVLPAKILDISGGARVVLMFDSGTLKIFFLVRAVSSAYGVLFPAGILQERGERTGSIAAILADNIRSWGGNLSFVFVCLSFLAFGLAEVQAGLS